MSLSKQWFCKFSEISNQGRRREVNEVVGRLICQRNIAAVLLSHPRRMLEGNHLAFQCLRKGHTQFADHRCSGWDSQEDVG